MVGIDLPTENIQSLIEAIRPCGTGSASLVSVSGHFVADAQRNKIGTAFNLSDAGPRMKIAITEGLVFGEVVPAAALKTEVYMVMIPVRAGNAQARWSLAVSLPMDKILAEARSAMYRSILLGVLMLILMVAVVVWLSRSIATRPMTPS